MFINYNDLLAFVESLPTAEEPEEIAACCYSNAIDDISVALVEYRIQHEMTQSELAKKLSISQGMVSQYEGGARNISIETLCTLMSKIDKKVSISFEDTQPAVPVVTDHFDVLEKVNEEEIFAA